MDGGAVEQPSKHRYTEMIEASCPIYMMMGMTFDEYWHSSFDVYKYYRQAWKAKRKEENHRDWLLGAYFYNAVGIALSNAFRKKGQKPEPYLSEPFPIFPLTKQEREEKERREYEKMNEQLRAWASSMKTQQEKPNASFRQPID